MDPNKAEFILIISIILMGPILVKSSIILFQFIFECILDLLELV